MPKPAVVQVGFGATGVGLTGEGVGLDNIKN